MSSITSGERIDARTIPLTWAAVAAVIQYLVLLIPGLLEAGELRQRITHVETRGSGALQSHIQEHTSQYTQIVERLARIETKIEAIRPAQTGGR